MKLTPEEVKVVEFFRQERANNERNPLWRAAWKTAQQQGRETFRYDGVEWYVEYPVDKLDTR